MAGPPAVRAQQLKEPARIGLISPLTKADTAAWQEALRDGLRQLGWTEGYNINIEYRYADGDISRLTRLVGELVQLKPDVIVTETTQAALTAQKSTATVPIVMVAVGDPVAVGLVPNLARPGGNITGLSQNLLEVIGKRLDMLKQTVPGLTDVAVIWNARYDISAVAWHEMQAPARGLGLALHSMEASSAATLNEALAGEVDASVRALFVAPGPTFLMNLHRIAEFAIRHRLASIAQLPEFVRAGGLLSFGPDRRDAFRRAAHYIDKILKGAKPADLPVEQPNKFETGVNLRTARALGITVPPLILAQADEVIE